MEGVAWYVTAVITTEDGLRLKWGHRDNKPVFQLMNLGLRATEDNLSRMIAATDSFGLEDLVNMLKIEMERDTEKPEGVRTIIGRGLVDSQASGFLLLLQRALGKRDAYNSHSAMNMAQIYRVLGERPDYAFPDEVTRAADKLGSYKARVLRFYVTWPGERTVIENPEVFGDFAYRFEI